MNLYSVITYVLSDYLVKGQTKILMEKMDYFKLSPREKEIVIHLCKGMQIKEICAKMFVSKHTIKNHIRQVYAKCGVQNRIELFLKLTGLTYKGGKLFERLSIELYHGFNMRMILNDMRAKEPAI